MWVILALYALLCLASYAKGDLPTNTFEELGDLRLLGVFFCLFAVLAGIYFGLAETDEPPTPRAIMAGALVFAVPLLVAFPVSSRDVFLYAFYGKLWAGHGLNPYLNAPTVLQADPWFAFLPQPWGATQPAPYGPLFIELTWLVHRMAGDSMFLNVACYKTLNVVLLAVSAYLLARLADLANNQRDGRRGRALALWLWSPLVLWESLGAAHNDLLMATLVLAALLFWLRGQSAAAWAFLALSVWLKWYSALLLPLWLWWEGRRGSSSEVGRFLLTGGLAFAAVSVPILAPFADSVPDIARRLGQAGTVLIPAELPPPLWVLFLLYVRSGWFDWQTGIGLFHITRVAIFALGLGWIAWFGKDREFHPVWPLRDVFWLFLLFFSLVVMTLSPWYLVMLCALGVAVADRYVDRVVAVITALALLSYFLTFSFALFLCAVLAATLRLLRQQRPS